MKKSSIISIVVIILLAIGGFYGYSFMKNTIYPLKYTDKILSYSKTYDIDPYLSAAIIYTESGFRNFPYEKGKKIGLMQIRESLAKDLAKEMGIEDFNPKNLEKPDISLKLGIYYLGKLKKKTSNENDIIKGWATRHVTADNALPKDRIDEYVKKCKDAKEWYQSFHKKELES